VLKAGEGRSELTAVAASGRGKVCRVTEEPVYGKNFDIRSYEVDAGGNVRPTALLNYMQEAAGDHARLLGIAVRDLLPRGLTWVLSRTHLKIDGSAASRETVRVATWPFTREGRFSCREFEMTGTGGRLIARATCSFALLDLATRRPVIIADRLPPYPLLPRRALPDEFVPLPRLDHPDTELSFRVGRRVWTSTDMRTTWPMWRGAWKRCRMRWPERLFSQTWKLPTGPKFSTAGRSLPGAGGCRSPSAPVFSTSWCGMRTGWN